MLVNEFQYNLPEELIAQKPLEPRDHSRLLVVDRTNMKFQDRFFYELVELLNPDDLLIFNDTRVIPARVFATKEGSDSQIEVFLLKKIEPKLWECLVRPGKKAKPGAKLLFNEGLSGEIVQIIADGARVIRFDGQIDFESWLERNGETPLPPYIHETLEDRERYQTVYSKKEGSVAAPTAGLHFTDELVAKLQQKGVNTGFLTLHVGLGTFRPVKTEVVEDHHMHSESFILPDELVALVKKTKQSGGRVIAVGTTVVRVLESQATEAGELKPGVGETAIFIYPGYQFKVIDGMITNFHLPASTLLMLVSAFAGKELIMNCYQHAVAERYRFFSFGDAMLIL